MSRDFQTVILLAVLGMLVGNAQARTDEAPRPNLIVILADDLGYGELGCYGQKLIQTPRLDRMAAEGLRFTQFYAGCTVCAPSRCVLMTGLHTGHCRVRGNGKGPEQALRPEDTTVAEVLHQAGYATALVGKWGLGDARPGTDVGLPNRQGFDYFFGYLNQAHAHNYYPAFLWRNEQKFPLANVVEPEGDAYAGFRGGVASRRVQYSHDLFAADALQWVREHMDQPFFLYLALTIPHANNEATRKTGNGAEVPDFGPYADRDWPPQDKGQAAMITRMDRDVGRLLDLLTDLNLARNTLVLFTSDNGPHNEAGHHPARFQPSGPLRGMKRSLYEGGIRVPTMAWWPGTVAPGSVSDHVGYFGDVMATACELAGSKTPEGLDSISLLPVITGHTEQQRQHKYLYWEFYEQGGRRAVRWEHWKAVRSPWHAALELYDLDQDLGEQRNVAEQHPDEVRQAAAWMDEAHTDSPDWHVPADRAAPESPQPFGADYPNLDSRATGQWWTKTLRPNALPIVNLDVPRKEVVAFALYTHDHGVLKLSAQLFPLKPGEPRLARLELRRGERWEQVATAPVVYPGWSAHFRIEHWDNTMDVPYRVRHGDEAIFEGLIRRDPIDKDEIVVGALSCNSNRTPGLRSEIVNNLKSQNPDVLFFAGDQSYHHTEHTAGWIEFGLQFRDILRDRPTVTIPDDHDVGHPNLWGENGKRSVRPGNTDGGYFYPPAYVNMVQQAQTWHLPDAFDPTPVERGITVYYTRLRVGGVDFAILEDRKFKSGPEGKIPLLGPRPDHITDEHYDPKSVDLPGLQLLGERQLRFLDDWGQDWSGAQMKAVLSQTAFCGAVHLHGNPNNRLLADLDCNGWPQTGRRKALEAIRRAWAPHICGDQHLGVVVQHGIDQWRDGPYGFTVPAIVNTIYGRWWHPADEQPGGNPPPNSPLPWTGDYLDGLGNKITMLAYANPRDLNDETQRGDGYGLVRFNKKDRTITLECWPRFAHVAEGNSAQYPGWPITIRMQDNDGRQRVAWLPELVVDDASQPVVQVIEDATGDVVYTVRSHESRFQPAVYAAGAYTIKVGHDRPDAVTIPHVMASPNRESRRLTIRLESQ